MSETELLPCPFCGGEALLDREYIFCDECHLLMRIDDRLFNGEAETYEEARKQAIKAWNTRKPIDDIVERLEEKKKSVNDAVTICWNEGLYETSKLKKGEVFGIESAIEIVKEVGGLDG